MLIFAAFAKILSALLGVMEILIVVRAVLTWISPTGGRWMDFLFWVTEPFLEPIRALFERWGFFRHSPIDFSPLIAVLLLGLSSALLSWLSTVLL